MPEPRVSIAYSVLAEGLSKIILPPKTDDTEILIVVQGKGGIVPKREDVREIRLDSIGVAGSRNEAIRQARGGVLFFGEEQVEWISAGVQEVLAVFDDNPRLAVLLGRALDETGKLRKRYPQFREPATKWNSARVGTIEIVVRPDLLRKAGLFFDENFGAGTENFLGDEFVFVADANRKKLKVEFFPITFSSHPKDSSGSRYGTVADARARAKVFSRVFGTLAPFVRLAFWARNPARFGSLILGLRFVTGAF